MRLALGRVDASPFGDKEILELKADIISGLPEQGLKIKSSPKDSKDVPLDYRFKELLLSAAHDPEVSPGSLSHSTGLLIPAELFYPLPRYCWISQTSERFLVGLERSGV